MVAQKLEKIETGIPGLDEILEGGLIANRPYLLSGGPGAGKTILGMQFLKHGAEQGEKSLYVSLEEQAGELEANMAVFGWNLRNIKIIDTTQEAGSSTWMIKSDSVVSRPEFNLSNLLAVISEKIQTYKPTRMVIDSITSIRMLYSNELDARREILSLMNFLLRSGCTTLLTSEAFKGDTTDPEVLMEQFLSSGVIKLYMLDNNGEMIRAISIDKMRGTNFDRHIRPVKITDNGIVIFPNESVFG
ncbi:MAG: ATPase domain-containing protein [Candidatus Altiarchaeota archaeon]